VPDPADLLVLPWLYPALFGMAVLDAFFFLAPSEILVLSAGAVAATHGANPFLVVLAAAAGAVAGDHLGYQLGRTGGPTLGRVIPTSRRTVQVSDWGRDALTRRGGVILLGARYIPGGRTAVTFSAGAIGYPRRRFLVFDVIASLVWASYYCLAGYLGGTAFGDNPWIGIAVGLGIAVGVGLALNLGRMIWARVGERRATTGRTTSAADH
jgi:membrane-associated protein